MNDSRSCPSTRCTDGSLLLGIVKADGTVFFLGRPITIDDSFLVAASRGNAPELRFRFAGACVQKGCANWEESGCQVATRRIGERLETPREIGEPPPLPKCGIRANCQWYSQHKSDACGVCPSIVRGVHPRD